MGQYTEHWAEYKRASNRRTLQLLSVLLFLPAIALLGYGISGITDWAIHVVVALLVVWLIVFTRLALRASRVSCPRCSATYSRGKYLVNCPKCGLRMLQEEPTSIALLNTPADNLELKKKIEIWLEQSRKECQVLVDRFST